MSKAEIIAELPHLSPEERAEVQANLGELAQRAWLDGGELTGAVVIRVLHDARHDRAWKSTLPKD